MSHAFYAILDIPCDVPVPPAVRQALTGDGIDTWFGGADEKGYDVNLDAAATFVADLEGSVDGHRWETLVSPIVTGQGAIAAHLNFVRVRVTADGDYGDDTVVRAAGKDRR
jgi:hypothetical protein